MVDRHPRPLVTCPHIPSPQATLIPGPGSGHRHQAQARPRSSTASDDGRSGHTLDYFVSHPSARAACLLKEHVVCLRLYTTAAFRSINNPLRELVRGSHPIGPYRSFLALAPRPTPDKTNLQPATPPAPSTTTLTQASSSSASTDAAAPRHPLPVTVAYLTDGIRKLRAVNAKEDDANEHVDLWRGMRNLELPEDFRSTGGTEYAPMSTTRDLHVALSYSDKAEKRLLFKLSTNGFIDRGADLQFLSAFPEEIEVSYSPHSRMLITPSTHAAIGCGACERVCDTSWRTRSTTAGSYSAQPLKLDLLLLLTTPTHSNDGVHRSSTRH